MNTSICADVDIRGLQAKYEPDHQLHYCPDMAAPCKAGRPKNQRCIKSPLEGNSRKKVKGTIDTSENVTEKLVEETDEGKDNEPIVDEGVERKCD